jgi:hypothetical protein
VVRGEEKINRDATLPTQTLGVEIIWPSPWTSVRGGPTTRLPPPPSLSPWSTSWHSRVSRSCQPGHGVFHGVAHDVPTQGRGCVRP